MEINDDNFEQEILNYEGVALVDFYAEWCGPCKMQGPIVDELAEEMAGRPIKIVKINVDESPSTSSRFNIMSIPALIIFKKGEVKETLVGLHAKDVLKKKIEAWL